MRLDNARARRRSIISLTPLIDVVFILLLFFMLTSRFQHYQAMVLQVPSGNSNTSDQAEIKPVMIELISNGRVSVNGALPITQTELTDNVTVKQAIANELPVYVSTDADVTLTTFTQLMDLLSASGLSTVSLSGVR